MVEIEKIRAEFANRLRKSCDRANVRLRGRAVDIKKELEGRGISTSTTAIGKWLNGESLPEPDKLLPLADWLRVRPEWLEYGRGEMDVVGAPERPTSPQGGNVEPGPPITTAPRRIEIMGTAQLGNDGYWLGLDNSDGWVETWTRDEDAYALRLKGDSMAPAIRNGWVAVCEPNHRLVPGEYVMVTTTDGQSMVKELLFESEDGVSVMSVNSAYERRTIAWADIDKIHYVGAILGPSKVMCRL
ncbi:S24 family peptidase [Pseudomonas guariconensis]|uniref:S24 family peptidase n=1 Tax=Pseudomonas guariconensis TaxID=1288410 RepID=UPI0025AB2055|nr:S24 family peptidase [Pseudomonas guariconensis]MDM9612465.1 S24 family peptidase [Pseudomonas guariconensis]